MGSWEGGREPPPHQLGGLGERYKLPQRGSGSSPDRKCILYALRVQKRVLWPQMSFSCPVNLGFIGGYAYGVLHRTKFDVGGSILGNAFCIRGEGDGRP